MTLDFPFQIAVLIMSIVIHEVSHGYAASLLGDQTARYQGRLTLNPIKHLDPMGSFIVPALSYFLGGFIIGWAKPVPYNPYNLRPGHWSEAKVAGAGPASNIITASIFGLVARFFPLAMETKLRITIAALSPDISIAQVATSQSDFFFGAIIIVVFINIILAVFNLVPIPPLDGSKLLFALFPQKLQQFRLFFERYGLMLVLFFVFFLWQFIFPVAVAAFRLITGLNP